MTGVFSKKVTALVLGAAVSSLSPGPAAGQTTPGFGAEEFGFTQKQLVQAIESCFKPDPAILRFQNYAIVVAGFDPHVRAQRECKINGHGARMKQIKRPDVDGAAGQIGAGWGRRFDDHF